jgi:signal transduction histidine kinase
MIARLTATQDGVDNPVHRLIVAEVVGGLIAVALAGALLFWLLRAALEPMAHVGRVAAQIAGGDRRQRLNPRSTHTELGRMAASFDAMVVALDASIEQARHSESAMRRFLADASHELRTPIAALHATVETLLRAQPPRPERDALEAQLARESARLGGLVDDLLNLARLEASEALRRERVDITVLARQIASETRLGRTQVAIDVKSAGGTIVAGDPDALGRALRNLLDNAVAATDGRGHIDVEVQRSDGAVRTRVSDDGPGVPPDERERIFEGFVRLDDAARPGAGLGLAIVRRIAQQHGGEVSCDDAALGACFTLRLPADVSDTAPDARSDVSQ